MDTEQYQNMMQPARPAAPSQAVINNYDSEYSPYDLLKYDDVDTDNLQDRVSGWFGGGHQTISYRDVLSRLRGE